jgi:uncharacterized glyoxalase superfamily protein PhnB
VIVAAQRAIDATTKVGENHPTGMKNRSVPVDTVLPHVAYRDLPTAIDWLVKHFGFVEQYYYTDSTTGKIAGAQLRLSNAYVMAHTIKAADGSTPGELGYSLQSLTIFFDDVDAHYRKVKSTGVRLVEQLHETVYGELQYAVQDVEGHLWIFSQHAKDLNPDQWGAKITK